MKKFAIFLTLFLCTAVYAQELPRIAVYVTGSITENEKRALGTVMLSTLVNSRRYAGIERNDAFLDQVAREHRTQRSGAIDDSQIRALGRQFGVSYICIVDVVQAFGSHQLSARIVDVETAAVSYIGEAFSPLRNPNDLRQASDEVVLSMFRARQSRRSAASQVSMVREPIKKTFWIGLGLDIAGAGLIAYGLYENNNIRNAASRSEVEQAERNRNIGYIVGGALLLSGISVHIFF